MFINSKLMETNYLLEKSLDVESVRKRVIANNIANVDVPHFKRSEVNFESELRRAIEQSRESEGTFQGTLADSRHIPFHQSRSVRDVKPRVNLDYNTTYRNDGNNVDIEKEMVDSSKNLMRYNALVTSLNQNYKMIKLAMRPV